MDTAARSRQRSRSWQTPAAGTWAFLCGQATGSFGRIASAVLLWTAGNDPRITSRSNRSDPADNVRGGSEQRQARRTQRRQGIGPDESRVGTDPPRTGTSVRDPVQLVVQRQCPSRSVEPSRHSAQDMPPATAQNHGGPSDNTPGNPVIEMLGRSTSAHIRCLTVAVATRAPLSRAYDLERERMSRHGEPRTARPPPLDRSPVQVSASATPSSAVAL
jgi:hypothetical protein